MSTRYRVLLAMGRAALVLVAVFVILLVMCTVRSIADDSGSYSFGLQVISGVYSAVLCAVTAVFIIGLLRHIFSTEKPSKNE